MNGKYRKHLAEVEAAIRKLPRAEKPEKWAAKNYVGAGESRLQFLDLTSPVLGARLKDGFSFSNLPLAKQWKIWDFIWKHSPTFDVMNGALDFAGRHPPEILHQKKRALIAWVNRSDNWAHSDGLSSIYARLLEHDRGMLPTLMAWAKSKNPWKRRQSLVALLYYASSRKSGRVLPFRKLIRFIECQISDPHYYVQKGVGWTIRETYNVYPKETLTWLRRNITRIAAPAWQAATEKLPASTKSELKKLRKERPNGPAKKKR